MLDGRARVGRENGEDVTAHFLRGGEAAAEIAARCGAERAILKDKSPSCGGAHVKHDRQTVAGQGVCAALLARKGLIVETL